MYKQWIPAHSFQIYHVPGNEATLPYLYNGGWGIVYHTVISRMHGPSNKNFAHSVLHVLNLKLEIVYILWIDVACWALYYYAIAMYIYTP